MFHAVVEELEERVRVALRSRRPARDGAAAANAPASAVAAFAAGRLRGLDGGIEEVVRRVDALVLEAMVDDLRFAVESGVIECADPERTALFLLGGIEKLVLAALERDEPVDRDGIVEVVVRIELFGLFSEETRRRGMGDG